jgi:Na+/proline symporter
MRGLVVAGIMATAMGSLSTALNALGTSFARDFVLPRREAHGPISEEARVRVLRWSTVLFAGLIILVGLGTAYYMAHNPAAAIIPLVLGILGFTFGSLLGIFLVAIGTRTRGSDWGNVFAMIAGFVAVVFFSNGDLQMLTGFTAIDAAGKKVPALVLAFPWRITLGTFVTIAVSLCFRTSNAARATMEAKTATHA